MSSRLLTAAGALAAALTLAPSALAGPGGLPDPVTSIDAPLTRTVSLDRAVKRSCVDRLLGRRAGVTTRSYAAPADGVVTVRLAGGRRAGDWDIAVFDSVTGARVASSAAFAATEVAQVGLKRGARVTIQVCRRSGRAGSIRLSTQLARVDLSKVPVQKGKIQLVKVFTASPRVVESLEHLGFDVTHDISGGSANVVLYGDRDVARLQKLGLSHEVLIGDMLAHERRARRQERAYAQKVGRSVLPTGRTDYRVFEDYQNELKKLVDEHPGLVKAHTLKAKSFQGRDIQVVEIARNVQDGDDGRPVFTLGGLHHAREWPASEGIMEFAWDLVLNPEKDARIDQILRDVRVAIMPITNPDGFLISRPAPNVDPDEELEAAGNPVEVLTTGVLLMGGTGSYKRKNCNPVFVPSNAVPCEFAIGVDPNRNYATKWGGPGASTNPNEQSYRGAAPFSEPEVQAVQELSSKVNSPVHVSTHNVAAKVLRPPGLEAEGFAPDEEALKELGGLMSDPTGYANEYGWQLYDTTGTTKDWGYDALGQYSYTVEMGPGDGAFHGNYKVHVIDQYHGTGQRAGRGLREAYINAALYTRNREQTSRIAGRAPAGRTLRIKKDFTTLTYEVCALADPQPFNVDDPTGNDWCFQRGDVQEVPEHVEITMDVPASGRFEWWVNPSTRPFSLRAGKIETYTLTCEKDGQVLETHSISVARGQTLKQDLPCGGTLPPEPGPGGGGGTTPGGPTAQGLAFKGLKIRGKRASLRLTVNGAALRAVKVSLLRKGKRVAAGRAKSLAPGTRTIVLKGKRRLRRGAYRVSLTAAGGMRRTASIRGR